MNSAHLQFYSHFCSDFDKLNTQDLFAKYNHYCVNNRPFGLNFGQISDFTLMSSRLGGLSNKSVLEIGGALPPEFVRHCLKPKSWTSVEYHSYQHNQGVSLSNQIQSKDNDLIPYLYFDDGWESFARSWKSFSAPQYDVVLSLAAFEHIYDLPSCLDFLYDVLGTGGVLLSKFSPIWSAPNGSHGFIPECIGKTEDHFHLLYDYSSLTNLLVNKYSLEPSQASSAAFNLYANNQLNRLTYEDYITIFASTRFSNRQIFPIDRELFSDIYHDDKVNSIKSLYPAMNYSCSGFMISFIK